MEKVKEFDFKAVQKVANKYGNKRAVMARLEIRLNEDYERLMGGDLWTEAVAEILIPIGGGSFKTELISSGGIFGLNSDIELNPGIFESEEKALFHLLNVLNVATDLFKDEEERIK